MLRALKKYSNNMFVVFAVLLLSACGNRFESGERVFVDIPGSSALTDAYAVGSIIEKKDNMYLVQVMEVHGRNDNPLMGGIQSGKSIYINEEAIEKYQDGLSSFESRAAIVKKVMAFISGKGREVVFPAADLDELKAVAAQQENEDLAKAAEFLEDVSAVNDSGLDASLALANMGFERLMEGDAEAVKKAYGDRIGTRQLAQNMRQLQIHQLVEIRFAMLGREGFIGAMRNLDLEQVAKLMPSIREMTARHNELFIPRALPSRVEQDVQELVEPILAKAKEPVLSVRRQNPPKNEEEANKLLSEDRAKLANLSEKFGFEILTDADANRYYFGPVAQQAKADDRAYMNAARSTGADALKQLAEYLEKYPNGLHVAEARANIEKLRKSLAKRAEAEAEYWTKIVSHKGAFKGKTRSGSIFTYHVIFDQIDRGGRSFRGRLAYDNGGWGVNKVEGKIVKDDDSGVGSLMFKEVGVIKKGKRKSLCTDCNFVFNVPRQGSKKAVGTRKEGDGNSWEAIFMVDRTYEFKIY